MHFEDTVTTLDELRAVIRPPSELVTSKEVAAFDDYCRDFIARSPFVLIASTDGHGSIDISPKGDPPGFVQVLDDTTLAIPDRPGNHRADTFVNVVQHPYVGLIFLIPGTKNTLRVRGRATIVRDLGLRESMAINDRTPDLALLAEWPQNRSPFGFRAPPQRPRRSRRNRSIREPFRCGPSRHRSHHETRTPTPDRPSRRRWLTHGNHQPKPKTERHSRRFATQSSTSHGDDSGPRTNLVGRTRRRWSTPLPHHDPIRCDPGPKQRACRTSHPHDQRNPHRTATRGGGRHAYRLRCELRQSQSRSQGIPCRPDLHTAAAPPRRSMRRRPSRRRLLDRNPSETGLAPPIDGPRPPEPRCTNACVRGPSSTQSCCPKALLAKLTRDSPTTQ